MFLGRFREDMPNEILRQVVDGPARAMVNAPLRVFENLAGEH